MHTSLRYATLLLSALSPSIGAPVLRDTFFECFCSPGTHLALINFDYTADYQPILHGEYVSDLGFGFTMSIGDTSTPLQPRILKDVRDDPAFLIDSYPEMNSLAPLLIVPSTEANNTNATSGDVTHDPMGGKIVFRFAKPTAVLGLRLVDLQDHVPPRVSVHAACGARSILHPAKMTNASAVDVVLAHDTVEHIKIKFQGAGGVANLKICIPSDSSGPACNALHVF